MKRMLTTVLATILLLTAFAATAVSVSAKDELIVNTHDELVLRNALANVQTVSGDEAASVLSDDASPGIALAKVTELADATEFMRLCIDHGAIPTLEVADQTEAEAVVSAVSALSCKDVTVISADASLLAYIRNKKTIIRTGLIVTTESTELTSEEANTIRQSVRSAPATFCVLDSVSASRQSVAELQELAVAVWVRVNATPDTDEFKTETIKAVTSGANGIITSSASDAAALINASFAEDTLTRTPVMIGHRGNPSQAPENSLSGFLTAYENGADVFEIDVEITKDGEIVIMHDSTLNRTTNYNGNLSVNDMTLSEIKSYYLLANDKTVSTEQVPTLREVLEAFQDKDCRIFVEFKGSNAANVPAACAIVKELGMEDRVDVISFNKDFLAQTQEEIIGMSTGYLVSPNGYTKTQATAQDTLYPSLLLSQMANSSVNPNHGVISAYYLQAATDRGMTVWPWTYTLGTNNGAFLLSPDGITTDDMQWVKDMCKYIEADASEVRLSMGKTDELTVSATTYGGEVTVLSDEDRLVTVITGDDCVTVENGKLVGVKSGTATVMFGYKTATESGSDYVVYTQPVTVKVINMTLIIALIALGVIAITAVVVWLVLRKKAKKTNDPV